MGFKLYDSAGNEIELKPDHVMVMDKDSFYQVPVEDYLAEMVFKAASNEFIYKEMIRLCGDKFEKVNGLIEELNRLEGEKSEKLHDGDTGSSS